MDNISSSLGFGQDPKVAAAMSQYRQEAALANARLLVEKVNEHCFEKCVNKPGASLSSGETTCLTHCMQKYMAAWNTVSRTYIERVQTESQKSAAGGGAV